MRQRLVALIVGFVVAAGWVPSVGAYQDQAIRWQLVEFSRAGEFSPGLTPGGDARVLIGLHSLEEFGNSSLLLVFKCAEDPVSPNRPISNLENVLRYGVKPRNEPWEDPGPRWRVCPEQSAILLEGEGRNFSLLVDFLREVSEGLSPRIPVDVFVLSEDELARIDRQKDIGCQWADIVGKREPSAQVVIDLYYRLDAAKHSWISGNYHDIFGAPDPDPQLGRPTGDYLKEAAFLPVDILSFQEVRPIPAETQDDGGKRFEETLRRVLEEKSALVGTEFCSKEDFKVSPSDEAPGSLASGALRASPTLGFGTYNLSGRFSTKWTADHSLHPGFGFRVEAWTDDFLGLWVKLGEEWIQSDGRWNLTIPATPIFQGKRLRIFYRTRTDYYDVQSLAGNHYRWVDPDWVNIPFTFSTGHRYADTDGGVYNGVGELVDAAMVMWSRLYWNGGINPVRGSPINIFAPNTTYDCGDGSGVPWSCANIGGNIWLISSHATQASVVTHELGHQLNYKFWGNRRPANSGGSHNSGTCYPGRLGMTMFEGFATFVTGWVGYPGRNVPVGGFGSGRWAMAEIEDRNAPPNCTNGWENERWVTRLFWDLHDTRSDGQDVLWFNNLGATPVLYLANGVASDGDARDMRFYETTYRNAASPGHQTHISNIFDQNRH